jgi:DNA-binding transcriptional LysR family regulator
VEGSDLALLATLDVLLQEGSVTKAARRVGLSTPAMSHALARIRARLGDPILVRAGRGMVLTPRAEALRAKVRNVIAGATDAFETERPFSAKALERSFVVHATDHVLTVLGVELDAIVHREAPRVTLRFLPNTADDPGALAGLGGRAADLSVGIYDDLPPEMRTRDLITDRFVCVVRKQHPTVKQKLSLEQYLALEHVLVAPRGRSGGYVDEVLAEKRRERRVVRAVPYFLAALRLVASTDYVLTVSEHIARVMAPSLDLRIVEPPLPLEPYTLQLVWHPRFDNDAGHRWLREAFLSAAGARRTPKRSR